MKLFNILSNKYNKNEWKVYKIGKHENKLQQEQNSPTYDINTHYNLCETGYFRWIWNCKFFFQEFVTIF